MTMYEILNAIPECVDIETGEIIDFERLEQLEIERDTKIENVALWLKELKAEAEAIKAERQILEKRQKSAENKVEQLKRYLSYALDGEKFKTAKVSISYRKSTSVEVDLDELMRADNCDNYLRYKEPEADKTAIKDALEEGFDVAGCRLIEKTSIQIK